MADLSLSVPAIEKLVDYAASGVGAVAGPMLANWRASKEGQARLTSARFDADVRRIEAESRAKSLVIIAEAQAEARQSIDATIESGRGMVEITREDITQSIEFQGRKRLANVASVVEDTADELGDKEVADHEPDPDWTARFFDCVQDVSSEDMKTLWSRILTGEVESPGRTSLRTLDTLRNMTQQDAESFRKICECVIAGCFVFFDWEDSASYPALRHYELIHIQDCGLAHYGIHSAHKIIWGDKKAATFGYQDQTLMITRDPRFEAKLGIPGMYLTQAGIELCRVVQSAPNMRYLQSLSRFLEVANCQLFYVEGAIECPDGILRWANHTLIEPGSEQTDGSIS